MMMVVIIIITQCVHDERIPFGEISFLLSAAAGGRRGIYNNKQLNCKMTSDFVLRASKDIPPVKLDKISVLMAPMTVSSSLLINGKVDLDRFKAALKATGDACPWLFCVHSVNEAGDVFVVPRVEEDSDSSDPAGFFRCEINNMETSEYSDEISLNSFLPSNVHEKMIRVDLAMISVDGLPISTFKLTLFNNHVVLSYRLNHVYFDQSSIVYLLKYIANAYTNGPRDSSKLSWQLRPEPEFVPRGTLVPPGSTFSDIEEFKAAAPQGYTMDPLPTLSFSVPLAIKLTFLPDRVAAFREQQQQDEQCSTNDILHAILLQALARYSTDSTDETAIRVR